MARKRGGSGGGDGPIFILMIIGLILAVQYVPGCGSAFEALFGDISLNQGETTTTTTPENSEETTETTPTEADTPEPTTTSPPEPPVSPSEPLNTAGLTVAPKNTETAYSRSEWPHWNDINGDGCDARQTLLINDALPLPTGGSSAQIDAFGCRVIEGDWLDDFWGYPITDPSDIDADHLVPLADAHRSGGHQWSRDQRRNFANDQLNLWAVSAGANRSKSDKTPDEWRPGRCDRSAPGWCDTDRLTNWNNAQYTTRTWCEYATRWTEVKLEYQLTVSQNELSALNEMLEYC